MLWPDGWWLTETVLSPLTETVYGHFVLGDVSSDMDISMCNSCVENAFSF